MRTQYLDLAGRKYPIRLTLTAAKELTERFGGIDKIGDALGGDVSRNVDSVNDLLTTLLRAGRVYAAACGEQLPPELECAPADLIDLSDISAVIGTVAAAMSDDASREVEAVSKNGEATRGS